MAFGRRTVPRRGSRLFVVYAIASLVPVLGLGAVLVAGYQGEARDGALAQARAQAAVIEEMAIGPVLDGRDLEHGLTVREAEGLLDATELSIFSGSVVRLRVRAFGGRVLFSDDGSTAGALPADHPDFRAAVAGRRSAALVADATVPRGQVLRVLLPIVPNASGQATGVLEVYLPYAALAEQAEAHLRATTSRMALALLALYLVLALISWSTTRRLRRHAAEREHQALHDPLTGLPNREAFRLRTERALEAGAHGAVVLLDLDRFKEVNDSLGHHAGDELLRVVARRMRETVRADDRVARLGGDEFGLVLLDADERAVREVVARLDAALQADVELDGVLVGVEASFGIALFPQHGSEPEDLLRHADAAMYDGKRGAASVVLFDGARSAATTSGASATAVLHSELRRALETDELRLHYQPKLHLLGEGVAGVEALLRWQHPERGLLGPGAFLPAIERSGLIGPVTEWVLARALRDRAVWAASGNDWPVCVNVSRRNLETPGFAASVLRMLEETGTSPASVVVEVTETALVQNAAVARGTLDALAAAGVGISLDDFGVGYTSLSHLRTLPVGEIKIDRSFVAGLAENDGDRAIVCSIVGLAHALGCSVTAEGVEDAATARWLRVAGCDTAQGFFFARPAPPGELLARFAGGAHPRPEAIAS